MLFFPSQTKTTKILKIQLFLLAMANKLAQE